MGAYWEKPCAGPGLKSYRFKGFWGWIMIGARDDADAMREAARSSVDPDPAFLEVWNGERYVAV